MFTDLKLLNENPPNPNNADVAAVFCIKSLLFILQFFGDSLVFLGFDYFIGFKIINNDVAKLIV